MNYDYLYRLNFGNGQVQYHKSELEAFNYYQSFKRDPNSKYYFVQKYVGFGMWECLK